MVAIALCGTLADRQIGVLEKQLDRKDEQIANQHARIQRANVRIAGTTCHHSTGSKHGQ